MHVLIIALASFILGGEVEHELSQPSSPEVEVVLVELTDEEVKLDRLIDKDYSK